MVLAVNGEGGGKLSLRLVSAAPELVEYGGSLHADGETTEVTVRVSSDGSVDVSQQGGAPEWLVALTRATLRTAWRSNKTGTPWPRRLTRWRPSSRDSEAG
jgi:hypothetical protein